MGLLLALYLGDQVLIGIAAVRAIRSIRPAQVFQRLPGGVFVMEDRFLKTKGIIRHLGVSMMSFYNPR
jgi:hypothetical protein